MAKKRIVAIILVCMMCFINCYTHAYNDPNILYMNDGIRIDYRRPGELEDGRCRADIERSGGEDDKEHLDSVTVFDQSKYAPKIEGGLYYRTVGYHFALLDGDLIPVLEDGIILESETGKTVSEL